MPYKGNDMVFDAKLGRLVPKKKSDDNKSPDEVRRHLRRTLSIGSDVAPGKNSAFVKAAKAAVEIPPIDTTNPEEVYQRFLDYLDWCIDIDIKPSIAGMANWMGVTTATVCNWKRGASCTPGVQKVIIKAYSVMEELWHSYATEGLMHPAIAQFIAKNMYGYKDKTEVEVTPNNPMGDSIDPEELKKRIEETIPITLDESEYEIE